MGIDIDYDGGVRNPYEDGTPKKRGRKRKTEEEKQATSQKRKARAKKPEIDYTELVETLVNGGEVPDEMLDEAFEQLSTGIDLVCDTTNTITKLRKDDKLKMEDPTIGIVIKWCEKMSKKAGNYTDEELDALETIKELADHLVIE